MSVESERVGTKRNSEMSELTSPAKEKLSSMEEMPRRRRVFIEATLFCGDTPLDGATDVSTAICTVSGTGTIGSECGTSTYVISGTIAYVTREDNMIGLSNFSLMGQRLSGYDSGDIVLKLAAGRNIEVSEDDSADLVITYSDDNNADLLIHTHAFATIVARGLRSLHLEGQGEGFSFAEFLADGETLDEESDGSGSDDEKDEDEDEDEDEE
jgi:hypothetical protein